MCKPGASTSDELAAVQTTTDKAHDDLNKVADDVKGELRFIDSVICLPFGFNVGYWHRCWQEYQVRPRARDAGC